MRSIAYALPAFPGFAGPKTYAAWPVWKDSTPQPIRFAPLPKKEAARLWHKARLFDRQTHERGKHGGAIGRTALDVLQVLLFDFLNYATGRLDPSLDAIAAKANMGRRTVVNAIQRLREFGLLHWQRRCSESTDELGRFRLRQETNAYAVLPPSHWRGYHEPPPAPPPDPGTWGDHQPLPDQLEQAIADRTAGDSIDAVLARFKDDPSDTVACALAGFFGSAFSAKP
jgi:hypothetical protein